MWSHFRATWFVRVGRTHQAAREALAIEAGPTPTLTVGVRSRTEQAAGWRKAPGVSAPGVLSFDSQMTAKLVDTNRTWRTMWTPRVR
jgi:hypothetical protein